MAEKVWDGTSIQCIGVDYRVPESQSFGTCLLLELTFTFLVTALQRRQIPSRLLFFPDENHWVTKPLNSMRWHSEVLQWIHQWTQPPA